MRDFTLTRLPETGRTVCACVLSRWYKPQGINDVGDEGQEQDNSKVPVLLTAGLYYVRPEWRGQRIGAAIHALRMRQFVGQNVLCHSSQFLRFIF